MACPIDGKKLTSDETQLSCEQGHTFDIARQGYVNLLPVQAKRSKNPGDSKAMVVARTAFLDSGVYEPIAKYLTELISPQIEEDRTICILDAGCGEGYYLDYVYQELLKTGNNCNVSMIGLDISKPAIVASSKRNRQLDWSQGLLISVRHLFFDRISLLDVRFDRVSEGFWNSIWYILCLS